MRLSTKVMAAVLAAAMSVSMLTACGGGGGGSAGGGNSSIGGGTSAGGDTGAGDNTDKDNKDDKDDKEPNPDLTPGTDDTDEGQTVAYEKSRTVKFFAKVDKASEYTVELCLSDPGDAQSDKSGLMMSSDGVRSYVKMPDQFYLSGKHYDEIDLFDKSKNQAWIAVPMEGKVQDKQGVYYKADVIITSDLVMMEMKSWQPMDMAFTWKTSNGYYIESQFISIENGDTEVSMVYGYKGESTTPEYLEMYRKYGGQADRLRVDFGKVEFKADEELLNFDNIFNNYQEVGSKGEINGRSLNMARIFKASTQNAKRATVW